MPQSATIIAPNDSALSRKHGPTPSSAITAPAAAGPTIRALWTITEFSATALTVRSGPTSSVTKLWRAGLSRALIAPRTNTSAKTIQTSTEPPTTSAHSASDGRAISACVTSSSLRLLMRSASTPPIAPKSRIGRNCSAAVRPTAVPEPVSFSTSHISATVCIQLPESEIT